MSKNNKDAVIIDGFRTPFIKSHQNFKNMSAKQLGVWLLRELLERTQVPINDIEGLILGNTNAMENMAPSIALRAGLKPSTPATTLKQMDLSSLESIISAVTKIKYDLANTLIVGGVENMSQTPVLLNPNLTKIRKEIKAAKKWKDKIKYVKSLRFSDALFPFADHFSFMDSSSLNQKKIAEALSEEFYISREEQDEYTKMSFEKAYMAQKNGKWKKEIVPVFPPPDFEIIQKDFHLDHRSQTPYESEPYFKHGTVTAGNSSFHSDGAAFLLIMSREKAQSLGYQPLVSIHSAAYADKKSQKKGLGAVHATAKVLENSHLNLEDVGLLEMNEDFSAQTLAYFKAFESSLFSKEELGREQALGKIKPEKYNINGGSLALGHPVSATVARMVLNLAKEMNKQNVKWGLAAAGMCEGQAGALLLENEGSL